MSKKPEKNIQKSQTSRELDPDTGKMTQAVHTEIKSMSWQGPLPPPQILAEYEDILPGSAARVFHEFQLESAHRREFERTGLRGSIRIELMGRISAFIFAIGALGVAAYCAHLGFPAAAIGIGGITISAVVGAFVLGRQKGDG
jgi:uncharacterized membrane protein